MVQNLRRACKNGGLAAIVKHDMAFHRYVLEITGDDNLVSIWLPTVQRMMLHYTRHEDMMESHREPAAILDAIRDEAFQTHRYLESHRRDRSDQDIRRRGLPVLPGAGRRNCQTPWIRGQAG